MVRPAHVAGVRLLSEPVPAGSNALTVLQNGNLGIATTTPCPKLSIDNWDFAGDIAIDV
jgi:hypothetical protein